MKITLLYVNNYDKTGIPIGLSYLISILKNQGHEISLFETTFYDFSYTDFNIGEKIDETGEKIISDFKSFAGKINPDLIGVSCSSLCLNFSVKMLESLESRPSTIFGGVGATADYMNIIKNETVDYICVGFGEECLPKLVESLETKKSPGEIPNLVYRCDGKIIKNKFSQSIDLSKLPIPDWDLFDKRHFERIFKGEIKRWGNFQLTRGCPFNCAYCINAYYHKKLRMKIYRFSAEKIIEEIKFLSQNYQLDIIRIFDECFGFGDLGYYKKFAELYRKEGNLPTIVETRPESITPEMIEILKDMNCISVSIGIEVGDENQRREMLNRYVSNDVIKRAFDLLHKANIRAASYNIVGFPDDTREKIFETIKLNKECNPGFINVFTFCPDPKTQLREHCLENDLLSTNAVVDYGAKSVIKNENLSKEELYGLFRTFKHYIKLPKQLYPLIERAEKCDEIGNCIFELLEKSEQANLV